MLEAQEGRMFRPLAWTETLAVGFSSLLAVTLVPVQMLVFIRGKLRPEARNPLSRITQANYSPILRLCLRFRKITLLPPRYPISVRYSRDSRDNLEAMRRVVIATLSGAQVPIGEVATVSFSRGLAMIREEDSALTGYVYLDLNTSDYGSFVTQADNLLRQKLALPADYIYKWSGEYEFELRAKERLKLILPVVFFVIFMLLYMVFHSVTEAAVKILPTIYALTGGLILQCWLGYNFSVAEWVVYIAVSTSPSKQAWSWWFTCTKRLTGP
jgi:Cu/Ag efflux pump CusA